MGDWRVKGSYFEACNCEAICPCRWQGGRRLATASSYGVCDFALSWRILDGHDGDHDLTGLCVVMAGSYDDGQPWHVSLYVDERADAAQHDALTSIFLGRAGGTVLRNFAKRIGEVYAVRRAKIEVDHTPRRWLMRAGNYVEVRAQEVVASDAPVTCGIPGHDRTGEELRAEILRVNDAPLSFEVRGRCGFEADFDYSSDEVPA
jgi:hypothetical protein